MRVRVPTPAQAAHVRPLADACVHLCVMMQCQCMHACSLRCKSTCVCTCLSCMRVCMSFRHCMISFALFALHKCRILASLAIADGKTSFLNILDVCANDPTFYLVCLIRDRHALDDLSHYRDTPEIVNPKSEVARDLQRIPVQTKPLFGRGGALETDVTFVKLDCEGAEIAMLEGAPPDGWLNVERLMFEWSFTKERSMSRFLSMVAALETAGFTVCHEGVGVWDARVEWPAEWHADAMIFAWRGSKRGRGLAHDGAANDGASAVAVANMPVEERVRGDVPPVEPRTEPSSARPTAAPLSPRNRRRAKNKAQRVRGFFEMDLHAKRALTIACFYTAMLVSLAWPSTHPQFFHGQRGCARWCPTYVYQHAIVEAQLEASWWIGNATGVELEDQCTFASVLIVDVYASKAAVLFCFKNICGRAADSNGQGNTAMQILALH
eukprot:6179259-Pleurochrysis_carterae.AAC.2